MPRLDIARQARASARLIMLRTVRRLRPCLREICLWLLPAMRQRALSTVLLASVCRVAHQTALADGEMGIVDCKPTPAAQFGAQQLNVRV